MPSRAVSIIDELYGEDLKSFKRPSLLRFFPRRRKRKKPNFHVKTEDKNLIALYRERNRTLTRARLLVFSGVLTGVFIIGISIYYFNILTRLEQDVFKEQAFVESLLQRRRNLSVNLAKSVQDYAVHERGIFKHVSHMRASSQGKGKVGVENDTAGAPIVGGVDNAGVQAGAFEKPEGILGEIVSMLDDPKGAGISLGDKLSGLMAVAENYPDLKLSENFQKFMEVIIETEKDLSDERIKYSNIVNTYTTYLRTFPGRFFALLYGFEELPYYKADREAEGFRPIDY
jgi:LemA protein